MRKEQEHKKESNKILTRLALVQLPDMKSKLSGCTAIREDRPRLWHPLCHTRKWSLSLSAKASIRLASPAMEIIGYLCRDVSSWLPACYRRTRGWNYCQMNGSNSVYDAPSQNICVKKKKTQFNSWHQPLNITAITRIFFFLKKGQEASQTSYFHWLGCWVV